MDATMDALEPEPKGGFGAFASTHRARRAARTAATGESPGAKPSAEPGGEPYAAPVVGPGSVAGGERRADPSVPPRVRADKTTVRPSVG